MRLEEKQAVTEALSRQLGENDVVFLTDFTGMNVKTITEFRDSLREEGLGYRIVKNTLMRRALEPLEMPDVNEYLNGPTGIVLSETDPVTPARILRDFAREHDDLPVVKIGIVDRELTTKEEVHKLADIPPREVLLGSIAGGLTASAGGIAGVMNALMGSIADMIGQIGKKNDEAS